MGVSDTKWPELLKFSLVDFFTGEVLIDKYVFPGVRLRQLSTAYSGVDWDMLHKANREGTCLYGRDGAREAIWKFVDANTVVVTHAGQNDFNVLRWIHPRIVDTQILAGGRIGLANLCYDLIRKDIQTGGVGHDSLEDTMANREIALVYLKSQVEI